MVHLRQAVLVGRDLEARAREMCGILGVEIAYRDPGVRRWGVDNVIAPMGTDIIEIISPFRDGTAAGRFLDRRMGDGGYMVILQVDDAAAASRRVGAMGVRVVEMDASLPNHVFTHFHPSDTGGVLLSLESVTPPPGSDPAHCWAPAGPSWAPFIRTDKVEGLAGIELQVADPATVAGLWARLLERKVEAVPGGHRIRIDNGEIRFVLIADDRGSGIRAYDIKAAAKGGLAGTSATLAGCRFNFV
ncbi:MAG: VOC family protein [Alphaproteobacteria bacterium]|nr:VOC family protein [Alphaproteobacteria bacterium]